MRRNQISIAFGLALGLASSVAIAQRQPEQRGFYGGLSLGQSKIASVDSAVDVGSTPSSVSTEETDTAWKLFAGYRIHRNVAIEGGYTDLGKFSTTRRFESTRPTFAPPPSSASAIVKISGFHLEGVGIIPIGDFSVLLKAGTLYSRTETSLSTTGGLSVENPNRKKSEFNLKLGIGGAYDVSRNWAMRMEYEHVRKVGDRAITGESDINMMSVGGVYKF